MQVLKHEGQGKKYDCLMGISGGLDSSYLAYLGTQKWGLRVAAVHIDDGYDTEAVSYTHLDVYKRQSPDCISALHLCCFKFVSASCEIHYLAG